MMTFDLSYVIVASRNADGFIEVQPEPYGAEGTLPNYEAFLPLGLMARPKDPTEGFGANALVMRHGSDGRVLTGHDPRWMSLLPDFGDGGAALYATTELSGTKKAPYVGFFGEGGDEAEGTFRISVSSSAGVSIIEVNPSTGNITITHPSGLKIEMSSTTIKVGNDSAKFLVTQDLMTWINSTLIPALANYTGTGAITVAPPGSCITTILKGT